MAKKYSSKINKIRTFALSLIFIGFFVMYLGIFFKNSPIVDDNLYVTWFTFYLGKYGRLFLDWNAINKNSTSSLS